MDEIFGEENFVDTIIWQKNYAPKNSAQHFSSDHDYILVYATNKLIWRPALLARSDEQDADYTNPDNDPRGRWKAGNPSARNYYSKGTYSIKCPSGRVISGPPAGSYWRMSEETLTRWNEEGRIWWGEDGNNAPAPKIYLNEVKQGVVPQTLWFYNDVGHTQEAKKELVSVMDFQDSASVFITPKPVRLIQRILELATDKNSIVLDSFAGSGTTAHAVLEQNKKDGGNRRFILCEMENYADTLTAERVRRVINGYEFIGTVETELCPAEKVTWTTFEKDSKRQTILDRIEGIENLERANYDKIEKKITDGVLTVVGQNQVTEKVPGLGGSFTFVELGESMDLERLLSETPGKLPSFASLARYLFYTITGQTLPEEKLDVGKGGKKVKAVEVDGPVLIGETPNLRVYLNYKEYEDWLRSPPAALTRQQAEQIAKKRDIEAPEKEVIVISASKYISSKALADLKIQHLQLPYALHRIQAT